MRTMLVLLQMTSVMNELSARITRRFGLTPHDVLVIAWMLERPGISATDSAARVNRARQNVQRTLERLERRGLVERRESVIRDRTSGWSVTEQGEAIWAELERVFSAHEGAFKHRGVPATQFVDALAELARGIKETTSLYPRLGLIEPEPEEDAPEWDL